MSALEPGTVAWAIAGDGCGPSDIGAVPHVAQSYSEARRPVVPTLDHSEVARFSRARPRAKTLRVSNPAVFARYGRLVVTSIQEVDGARLCQPRCDCGRVMRWTLLSLVASGAVRSCGCDAGRAAS